MRLAFVAALVGILLFALDAVGADAQAARRLYFPMITRDSTPTPVPTPTPSVVRIRYQAHVQDEGWKDWQENNNIAGTEDDGKRLEAFRIEPLTGPSGITVRYRAHVGGIGWQDWKRNGEIAGTIGEQRTIEAIQIALDNSSGNNYLSYEARSEGWGWLGAVRDSWFAGTTGQARKVTAFRAYIRTDRHEPARVKIAYNVYVQDRGYLGWKRNGEENGTIGETLRLEAMKVLLYNRPENMDLEVRSNVEGEWQVWLGNGAESGTTAQSKRIVAFEMRLVNPFNGTVLSYGGHFQDRGWLEYASDNPSRNNPILGNPSDMLRLESLRAGLGNAID